MTISKDVFYQGTRQKLRFKTATKGEVTMEQLYDLPLTSQSQPSLDQVAVLINSELTSTQPISFVKAQAEVSKEVALLQLKLDIVKFVIQERLEENAAKLASQQKAQQVKLLQEQITLKSNEALLEGSVDELKAKLAALQ